MSKASDYRSAPMQLSADMRRAKDAIEAAIGEAHVPTYGGHRHRQLRHVGKIGARKYGNRWTSMARVRGRMRAVGTHATREAALSYAEARYLAG